MKHERFGLGMIWLQSGSGRCIVQPETILVRGYDAYMDASLSVDGLANGTVIDTFGCHADYKRQDHPRRARDLQRRQVDVWPGPRLPRLLPVIGVAQTQIRRMHAALSAAIE